MTYYDDVINWLIDFAKGENYAKPNDRYEEDEICEHLRDYLYEGFWDNFMHNKNDALQVIDEMNWYDNWDSLFIGDDWDYIHNIVDFAGTALINYVERHGYDEVLNALF